MRFCEQIISMKKQKKERYDVYLLCVKNDINFLLLIFLKWQSYVSN